MNAMAEMKLAGTVVQGMLIKFNDVFECLGPAAGNVSKNQGVRIISRDGFRIIFRLSGTGVAGGRDPPLPREVRGAQRRPRKAPVRGGEAAGGLALKVSKLEEYTGRDEPTVIT